MGKFSTTQKVGVAAAVIVSPWFLPVALFPSIVRKTVAIAAASKARAEQEAQEAADPVAVAAKEAAETRSAWLTVAIVAAFIGVGAIAALGGHSSNNASSAGPAAQREPIASASAPLAKAPPLQAQTGEGRAINSAEDIALRARLTAEADANRVAKPAPSSSSWYRSDNPWGPNYSGIISRDAAQHLLIRMCEARGEC